MAPLLSPRGPLTCATVRACEGQRARAVVGHMVMGTGACAPIEAGPRGTRIWGSWVHTGGDMIDGWWRESLESLHPRCEGSHYPLWVAE